MDREWGWGVTEFVTYFWILLFSKNRSIAHFVDGRGGKNWSFFVDAINGWTLNPSILNIGWPSLFLHKDNLFLEDWYFDFLLVQSSDPKLWKLRCFFSILSFRWFYDILIHKVYFYVSFFNKFSASFFYLHTTNFLHFSSH